MHHITTAFLSRTPTTVPRPWLAAGVSLVAAISAPAAVITFDELDPGSQGYWNGSDESGGFTSGGAFFENSYYAPWQSWSGFGYSNQGDTTTADFTNQYSSFAGGGLGGSGNFAVAFGSAIPGAEGVVLTFPSVTDLAGLGAWITNTTYTALSVQLGDDFSAPFGPEDYLKLTIHGYHGLDATGTVDFYLADYRNGATHVVDTWTWVGLSALGSVDRLTFSFDSSDVSFGFLNKPAYFAMDDLLSVPEPSTAVAALAGLVLFARRRR